MRAYPIPKRKWSKYNQHSCLEIVFSDHGLRNLQEKCKQVNGLPGFLHNTFRRRKTHDREMLIRKPHLCTWTKDRKFIIAPNYSYWELFREKDSFSIKYEPDGGFGLLAWFIHPTLLSKYGWRYDANQEVMDSFMDFINARMEREPYDGFRYFKRSRSQDKISLLEKNGIAYLSTILDLTAVDLPTLIELEKTVLAHLKKNYGVDRQSDSIVMYFHFPYPDSTTTLHMHISVNQGMHPLEACKAFTLHEIIEALMSNISMHELVLSRARVFVDHVDLVHEVDGITVIDVENPYRIRAAHQNSLRARM